MNGKRGLSRESAAQISKRLGFSHLETEVFCDLVESKHARSKVARIQAQKRLKEREMQGIILKFLHIDQERFSVIADWYHLAILELMKTKGYKDDPLWIAKRLNLSLNQVEQALERLQKFEMIKKVRGKFEPTESNVYTPDGVPSQAIKIHHEQFLTKAIQALFTQPNEERDFRGLTIKCKKDNVPKVREKIKQFLIDLDAELSEDAHADEVYELCTNFFKLTQNSGDVA